MTAHPMERFPSAISEGDKVQLLRLIEAGRPRAGEDAESARVSAAGDAVFEAFAGLGYDPESDGDYVDFCCTTPPATQADICDWFARKVTDAPLPFAVTLKGLKVAAFASEETTCFQATVLVNGKPACIASNDGHGGCNLYRPTDRALYEQLEAWAKTLPPLPLDPKIHGDCEPLAMDLDLFIGELVEKAHAEKQLARLLKSKLVFTMGGKVYTTKNDTGARAYIARKHAGQGVVVLNDLSMPEAVGQFLKAGE